MQFNWVYRGIGISVLVRQKGRKTRERQQDEETEKTREKERHTEKHLVDSEEFKTCLRKL